VRFVSLFSGVGGFDLGLEAAGWECVAQVEWDQHCQAVLARHWPDVPKWHDVSDVAGADLPAADAVVFGSPCQDLSVAGKRAGFNGERSVLFYEAVRIIKEMQDVGRGPAWVVWENVTGALSSSDGRDFGAVLRELADLGALDIAWRVLDARFFGVPQRRRRVFVVADLAGHRAGEVFPESTSMRWHPHSSLAPWQDTTTTTEERSAVSSDDVRDTVTPKPLLARDNEGVDCDGASNNHLVVQSVSENQRGEIVLADYAHSLIAGGSKPGQGYAAIVEQRLLRNDDNRALSTSDRATIAFHLTQDPITGTSYTPQLSTGSSGGGAMLGVMKTATIGFSHTQGLDCQPSDQAWPTLRSEGGGQAVATSTVIRRLTPIECERLMGWPDDHTRWRADGTELADSHRYRMCGNGVAAPVAQWIGERISEAAR
jgi:DNA (cytosine-5)-methyltransferase 1